MRSLAARGVGPNKIQSLSIAGPNLTDILVINACPTIGSFTYNTCSTRCTCKWAGTVGHIKNKQNVTISLNSDTIQKAKVLAAQRSTSISRLLAEQIESLVGQEEAYERSQRVATALLKKGFHLGGNIAANRDELHER